MPRILIIDDEINLRETIAEMLTYLGYDIFLSTDGKDGLEKVKEIQPDLIICDIMMPVLDGYGGMDHLFPDYSQTIIQQKYTAVNGQVLFDGSTGLIENEKNIWLHPFRGKYFSVTEFSPFPYVKLPLKEGTKWTWRLPEIDSRWSDPRIIEYKGTVEATYNYKIVDEKNLKTAFGVLSCFVIEAEAKNRIGKSKLRSYFNPQYGFVLLEYTNIDKSKLILELIQINQTKK